MQLNKNDSRLILISGHGPACASQEGTSSWWTATANSIPASKRTWSVIAFLDANARAGSVTSSCIGSCGAETENEAGTCLHQWAHDLDLVLPQTFDVNHAGDHTTWRHSTGKEACLDYVAISKDIYPDGVCTSIASVVILLSPSRITTVYSVKFLYSA